MTLSFTVHGDPKPQGSKRHVGKGILVESSKDLKQWRRDVTLVAEHIAKLEDWTPPPMAHVALTFNMRRPVRHYFREVVRDSAPYFAAKRPDGDKLARAIFDSLTDATVVADDSHIVSFSVVKRYVATGERPGVDVFVAAVPDEYVPFVLDEVAEGVGA